MPLRPVRLAQCQCGEVKATLIQGQGGLHHHLIIIAHQFGNYTLPTGGETKVVRQPVTAETVFVHDEPSTTNKIYLEIFKTF